MREIYFHEDDYCQIELVAAENQGFCAQQMGLIDSFAEQHQSGAGWTKMFIRTDNPSPLSSKLISRRSLSERMPITAPQFDQVFTGYADYRERCNGVAAWGPGSGVALFVESNPDDVVTAVWFDLWIASQREQQVALDLLRSLSDLDCLLADWGWSRLYQLNDSRGIEQYIAERLVAFNRKPMP